jgi:hypothetical protein
MSKTVQIFAASIDGALYENVWLALANIAYVAKSGSAIIVVDARMRS